ncbi:PRTRC system protein E [Pedobacter aquatilis]|uniref:PRTRC system protein E n=1 Tax=Pedobacter aquatilis TaxID=351343 RepID=UPI0025B4A4DC|nr:PRTRC system protein E [Pedobacter aquatilis]MDN3588226.1 PRTRC system protein E [Pedobacter aquatilis]
MKTNFFRMLYRLSPKGEWRISIASKETQMVLSIRLSDDDLGKNIPPMLLSGTPEELDEGFYDSMEKPVELTTSLFLNLAEYNQSLAKAQAAIREKAGAKPAKSADNTSTSENKKSAFEDAIKKVQEMSANCKYADALAILPLTEDYPDKTGELEKLRIELERKNTQLSLL